MTPLAHGGGAPEAAMVVITVLVVGVFGILERRTRARERDTELDKEPPPAP